MPPVLRSAGVRLALSYAVMFGLSALLLIVALWLSTLNLLNRQVDAAIMVDAKGLAEQWNQGGPRALLLTIDRRVAANVDDDAIYYLVDPAGRRVAGNLNAWPPAVTSGTPFYEIQVEHDGVRSLARLHRFELPSGYLLLVGRDVESRGAMRSLLAQTLAWGLLLIGLLGLAGATLIQQLFRRMLSHVSATAAAISSGDLSRRVTLSGRGDEFDRLAATINDMLDRISRLMDGVRQVSNAIAHDLRTPITRARARLEDAAAHAGSAAELRAAIERAVADLDGITAVFQALLRIAEIEVGAARSAFDRTDARPLLTDLADLYGAAAEENGLRLELKLDPDLNIRGDRDLIQQAVANLLDNAIKFSPPGSVIELRAEMKPAGLVVSVVDQGPGIPPEDVARATERFYRAEKARHTPGFGLGLALVRAVAVLHGGSLVLENAPPGLRATLSIPARAEPRAAGRVSSPSGTSPRARPDVQDASDRAPRPASPHEIRGGHPPAPRPAAPVG